MLDCKNNLKLGFVIADEMEFLSFYQLVKEYKEFREYQFYGNDAVYFSLAKENKTLSVFAVRCGIGKVNAAMASAFLIAQGIEVVINIGLSGGISNVRRGDIVAGSSYIEADFDLTPLGYQLGSKPDQEYSYDANHDLSDLIRNNYPAVKIGKLGCGDFFLNSNEKKALYKNKFDLIAFDMESGAIASVCYKSGVPFIAIRKISDDAADSSPDEYREMNDLAETCLTEISLELLAMIFEQAVFWI